MNFMISSRFWSKAAALSCLLAGSAAAEILLIEDQSGFGPLADNLRAAGYTVTESNYEFANGYANLLNPDYLDDFNLVVYGERGTGGETNLPANVGASLEAYIANGGNLLVTGWDSLYPNDTTMASLVRATMPSALVGNQLTWKVVEKHPIVQGPFGDFLGQTFNASGYDVSLVADTSRGAIELVAAGDPRVTGRIIFTDLPGKGGSVGFWNGGTSGTSGNAQPDFTGGGIPEAIFRNYAAFMATGIAGADIQVGDSDGDGFVTQVLDGSRASQVIDDIGSWVWTLPGGVVLTGERPEVTLPATNTPITATLTVRVGGATYVDSVNITVFTKTAGLFTDFADPRFTGIVPTPELVGMTATLEGNTLVIDPVEPSSETIPRLPSVFRRVAGVWTPSPFTEPVTNIRAINDTTLVSGNFASGTDFKVHRLIAGEWDSTRLGLSAPPPIVSRYNYAFDPESVIFADLFNDNYGRSSGRVFAYDWPVTGDNWNHTELFPADSITPDSRWGEEIAVDGDLVAVVRRGTTAVGKSLSIFRKSGTTWNLEGNIEPDPANPAYPDNFSGGLSIGNGVVVTAVEAGLAGYSVVHEKIDGSWVQTGYRLEKQSADFNTVLGVDVDDDGLSFVVKDSLANFLLYQRDPGVESWSASNVQSPRKLPLADLSADPNYTKIHFSGGEIVVSDPVSGVVRIFNKNAPFDRVNAAPKANAGEDIATTSFDGQEVGVFLDGLGSTDANYEDHLEAEWTWAGGGRATGLFTFAEIHPSVTSVELKITDSRGAVSHDTVMVNIDSPPVVDPGDDVTVVDTDGDGKIRLNVSATADPSDTISTWSWSWPGGLFSGQAGEITLNNVANGLPVNLTAIDENGLSSQTSFNFSMLSSNPAPLILQPTSGGPTDAYGAAAAIQNGVALIGAPDKPYSGRKTGASYLAQNLNGLWPQIQLAPGTRQGDAMLIDGDFAFVGAKRGGAYTPSYEPGEVLIYKKSPSGWLLSQTLTTPAGALTFGSSLAKSGNQLLVGAPKTFNDQSGIAKSGAGAVYLYEFEANLWTFKQRFDPPTPVEQGRFGTRVAIAGDLIAISQPGSAPTTNSSVMTFEKVNEIWIPAYEFVSNTPSPPQFNEEYHFGQGLGLSESELLIGSPVEGVVYRRTRTAGNWGAATLINPNRYFFGASIAMKDDVAVVGAVLENTGLGGAIPGSVTSFLLKGGSWQESGYLKLTPAIDPNIVETPNYSAAVSFDGRDLIVGAPTARNSSGVKSGKAYIYRNYAGLNPNANYEPLANAGTDASVSVTDTVVRGPAAAEGEPPESGYVIIEPRGSEMVTLNGSASTDRENAIDSWEWTWPGGSASGEIVEDVPFPVGTTVVTLTVTDDKGIVNSDTVNVTVALDQTPPAALPATNNTLTVNLPVPEAKWRLSSEFLWHAGGESANDIVLGQPYQIEILGYPGSAETVTTLVTPNSTNFVANLTLILPLKPVTAGIVSFPETAQGFAWRLRGEPAWRDVLDDGDALDELINATVATGELIIDYKPVTGYATPASQLISIQSGQTLALNWNDYQRIDNFDPAKTFTAAISPNLSGDPYQYIGMIRTPLGRGTGTVVAPRVVLTAAHLFFDSTGLQWADTQWFPRQQEGERQAPPITPRGILYQTAYAQIVAPDTVQPPVASVPADKKEADFAVLYFSGEVDWVGGSANYLQSTTARNWLTGPENKQAVGYPQRSQQYEQRGKIFGKNFATALSPLDTKPLPLIYETGEMFGDGGASGSALFVQPQGVTGFYPAAILLAGQDRAVYRMIDQDVGRMIQDAQDAATGNDEVLDSNYSLVTYGAGGFRALEVGIATPAVLSTARWSVKPSSGTTYSNLTPTQRVGYSNSWANVTVSFSAVSGYITPPPITLLNSQVPLGVTTIGNIIYEPVSGFDLWKQSAGIASENDDRDGDGKSALMEYAINGNPDSGADPTPIRMAANPSQPDKAEFEIYVSSTADKIRYVVKASNTLPPTNVQTLATFTKADGTNGYKRVTDTQPKSASPRRFAWVEYTHDRNPPATP